MKRRLDRLYCFYKEYGHKCFFAKCLSELFPYSSRESSIRKRILHYKFDVFIDYLTRYYMNLDSSSASQDESESLYKGVIWTAWLQGEAEIPEVIRMNLASIVRNAGKHNVVVISKDNLDQYLDLSPVIKSKYQEGIISYAHYSDIIRIMLLEKYGGLWLDASMFLCYPIDENAFSSPFFSVGFQEKKGKYISDDKWVVGIIGGKAKSIYISNIAKMLLQYWTEHNVPIDYFVFDYLIAVLYQKDLSFQSIVDQLPRMPFFLNTLIKIINEPYRPSVLQDTLPPGQISCLSYRNLYHKTTKEGQMTNYGYLYHDLTGE